jgi:glycerophosphoryl diester phosphodiesterase
MPRVPAAASRAWSAIGALALALSVPSPLAAQRAATLVWPQAHAHNDYLHARPLHDALQRGFGSLEVDLFLVEGQLLVAHDLLMLDARRTVERLYLDPLRERFHALGRRIFADETPLLLLVDLKTDGPSTYAALAARLGAYAEMLTRVEQGRLVQGAVTIVVSGNRPIERILADTVRYAGFDGRLSDLDSNRPAHEMPLVSDNWRSHFRWTGTGPMPEAERLRLQDHVARAHRHGRRLRYWNTPERSLLWAELLEAKVDLINTDQLDRLREFLLFRKLYRVGDWGPGTEAFFPPSGRLGR